MDGIYGLSWTRLSTKITSPVRNIERGAAFAEASISLAILIFIILGLGDLFRIGYTALALQYTADRTARWAIVGSQIVADPLVDPPVLLSREESATLKLQEYGASFGLEIFNDDIRICPLDEPGCDEKNVGDAEEFFVISVEKRVPTHLVPGGVLLDTQVLGRNEPAA